MGLTMPLIRKYLSFFGRRRYLLTFMGTFSIILLCLNVYHPVNDSYSVIFSDTFWTSEVKLPHFSQIKLTKQLQKDLQILPQFRNDWDHNETSVGTFWKSSQNYPYMVRNSGNIVDVSSTLPTCPLVLDNSSNSDPENGAWKPLKCKPRERIAIIIPYRDRISHLEEILGILHPMLQTQQASYQIFISEQAGTDIFNKGILMNAAFLLAMNVSRFDCVIFHDVDLIPLNYNNFYRCSPYSRHLSVAVNTLNNKLPYESLLGGAMAFSAQDFLKINGYSTMFWGWGGEDDDMTNRIVATNTKISRPKFSVGIYKMEDHKKRSRNMLLYGLIRTARIRYKEDGLTSLKFKLISTELTSLYTRFFIDVGKSLYALQQISPAELVPNPSNDLMSLHFAIRDANDKLIQIHNDS